MNISESNTQLAETVSKLDGIQELNRFAQKLRQIREYLKSNTNKSINLQFTFTSDGGKDYRKVIDTFDCDIPTNRDELRELLYFINDQENKTL